MAEVFDQTGITNAFLGGFVEQVFNPEAFPMTVVAGIESAELTWEAQEGALYYRVYCGPDAQTLRAVADYVRDIAIIVGGLTGGVQYFFQVTAVLSPRQSTSSTRQSVVAGGSVPPTVTLDADPETINLGESTSLSWTSTHATALTGSGAWNGSKALSGTEDVTPTEAGDIAYDLTAVGPGGSAMTGVIVHVLQGDTCPQQVDAIFGDGTGISLPTILGLPLPAYTASRAVAAGGVINYDVDIDTNLGCAFLTGTIDSNV